MTNKEKLLQSLKVDTTDTRSVKDILLELSIKGKLDSKTVTALLIEMADIVATPVEYGKDSI